MANGSKDPRLPPGQGETKKFPVVSAKDDRPTEETQDLDRWRLIVDGLIDRPLEITYSELLALPQRELVADIHCVTGWSQFGMSFTGLPLADLLAACNAHPLPEAQFVRFEAYSINRHDTSLPLSRALDDTWLIHSFEGQRLTLDHGCPLRAVSPSRYFYKSVKWLHRIEFLAEDRLGFWERDSSYHNNADPWAGDERYSERVYSPEQIELFRNARSYDSLRGSKKILLGVDLRGWAPANTDLRDLYLKNCDLRNARLAGVDLRGANLTRSNLEGASLVNADLRGADLEGASFIGADLTNADLRDTALSAARFVPSDPSKRSLGARIEGLRWEGAAGLLEEQEAYLSGS